MRRRALVLGLSLAWLVACADIDTVRDAPAEKGKARTFVAEQSRVATLVSRTLLANGLEIESTETKGQETVIIAIEALGLFTWGEFIRVRVLALDESHTQVTVYWRSRFRDGLITPHNWEQIVFSGVADQM